MQWFRSVTRELLGLFIDDGSFALAILLWLAAVLALSRLTITSSWPACALFCGLAAILIESVLRYARRHR
ncbi:MAG TPA: hypothetical protein VGU46_00755 [Acidobacteriaceae bacterium]|nr:hypothetical protein [Acidobacteriaceae bacterium]